ncbi:hypothetical protein BH10ACT8_BH10ACT8_00530 [soil metagenome]
MTATVSITKAVEQAALAALANIPIADALTVGTASTSAAPAGFNGVAVSARFTGDHTGEVLVAVEQSVADALQNSPLGALDLTAALAPALAAACATLGNVVTGPGQALAQSTALDAILSKQHSAVVGLSHNGSTRALVGLAVIAEDHQPATPTYPSRAELDERNAAPSVRTFVPAPVSQHGLEMLRDVAMEVTAQIGGTRMTVHELLSLSDGAVIELDRAAVAPSDRLVSGHLIARGEVVVVDENFGLRITEIVSTESSRADQL